MQRSKFWQIVSFALDAAVLTALLWFFVGIGDNWWTSFCVVFVFLTWKWIYAPAWQSVKSMMTGGDVEEIIVEKFLRMFTSRGYPPPQTNDELNAYLLRTMRNGSLPEDLKLEAAGLHRELEIALDFRTYDENIAKIESAKEAFSRFKGTSAKDPDWYHLDEEALPREDAYPRETQPDMPKG